MNVGNAATQVVHATNLSLILNSASTFENVIGRSGADTLLGNGLANTLTGRAGNDLLNGGAGNDNLFGGLNDDTYVFGVPTAAEADQVNGFFDQGMDTVNFATLTTSVVLNLGSTAIQNVHTSRTLKLNSGITFENAIGGSGADTLTGNSQNNILTGNNGGGTLDGGTGNDDLQGGLGDDTYRFTAPVGSEVDIIREQPGQGIDTINFSSLAVGVTFSLSTNAPQSVQAGRSLQLNSASTFENVIGGSGDDTLVGNSQANTITCNNGNDIIVGNAGNDALSGGNGRDILIGGLGIDTLSGGNDDDILIAGRTTNDTLFTRLNDLRTEWVSVNSYGLRISRLRTGVGASVASLKAITNVLNDAPSIDRLTGGGGIDWYFRALDDVMTDLLSSESLDLL